MSPPADQSLGRGLGVLAAATLATAALAYAAPATPAGAAPSPQAAGVAAPLAVVAPPNSDAADVGRLERTIRFLQDTQNPDGGFGGRAGGASDPGISSWVALALAAGGVNPQDQRTADGVSAYDYLVAHAGELDVTTDYERVLMVAIAAGADPRDFGGQNLVQTLLARQLPDGSFPYAASGTVGAVNATAFAIIPLSVVDDPALAAVIDRACDWLLVNQDEDGAWSGGADLTASVIEALRAAGRDDTPQERDAWEFLRSTRVERDGGFGTAPQEPESNTASTAWAVQGMWAAGLEPRSYAASGPGAAGTTPGLGPLDFLTAMQDPQTGQVRWKASVDLNPVWMTAYAAPAFAGYPLPIPAVARSSQPSPQPQQTPPPTAPGGVTSGGGGAGAPNFSRPEPGSTGDTAGGVRRVDSERQSDQGSTKRRSGNDEEQQRTTAASNGRGDAGVTRDVAAPDEANGPGALSGATPTAGSASGSSAGPQVAGMVVNAVRGGADGTAQIAGEAVAPGLISAEQRRAGALAAGLGSGLLLCMLLGMKIERDQLAERLP